MILFSSTRGHNGQGNKNYRREEEKITIINDRCKIQFRKRAVINSILLSKTFELLLKLCVLTRLLMKNLLYVFLQYRCRVCVAD